MPPLSHAWLDMVLWILCPIKPLQIFSRSIWLLLPSVEWFVNPPEEPKENSGLRLPPSPLVYFPAKAVLSTPVSCLCGGTLTLTCRSTTSASKKGSKHSIIVSISMLPKWDSYNLSWWKSGQLFPHGWPTPASSGTQVSALWRFSGRLFWAPDFPALCFGLSLRFGPDFYISAPVIHLVLGLFLPLTVPCLSLRFLDRLNKDASILRIITVSIFASLDYCQPVLDLVWGLFLMWTLRWLLTVVCSAFQIKEPLFGILLLSSAYGSCFQSLSKLLTVTKGNVQKSDSTDWRCFWESWWPLLLPAWPAYFHFSKQKTPSSTPDRESSVSDGSLEMSCWSLTWRHTNIPKQKSTYAV